MLLQWPMSSYQHDLNRLGRSGTISLLRRPAPHRLPCSLLPGTRGSVPRLTSSLLRRVHCPPSAVAVTSSPPGFRPHLPRRCPVAGCWEAVGMNTCVPSACPPESPHPCPSRSLAIHTQARCTHHSTCSGSPPGARWEQGCREGAGIGGFRRPGESAVDLGAGPSLSVGCHVARWLWWAQPWLWGTCRWPARVGV